MSLRGQHPSRGPFTPGRLACYPTGTVDLAVYVHFPWCLQRCPYCDFATEAIAPARIPHEAYARAVAAEFTLRMASVRSSLGVGESARPVTLFFGGGTPSLWEPEHLGAVIAAVRAEGHPAEVTVECNPTSLDADRAAALRSVGVDRVSIGVQSLRDRHLRYLGRLHDAAGALAAVRTATAHGGLRVSADVMYGLAEQRRDELVDDVHALLDAGVEHLSCYSLTIEPATRFGELARKGRLPRLTDDDVAVLYEAIETELAARGYAHYEVSNYARPGAESMHNAAYWRGEAYLGLGAGAVGCVPGDGGHALRWRNDADPQTYVRALDAGELPPGETEALDPETRVREGLLLGMRTREGTDLAVLAARTGRDPRLGREAALERQKARGNLEQDGQVLRIPQARWLLADEITAAVF